MNNLIIVIMMKKTCIICGSIFVHGQNHHIFCNCHRIFIECAFSKKYFEKDLDFCSGTSKNSIIDAILNNNKIEAYIRKFKQYGMWEKEEYIEKNLPRVKNFAKIGLNAQNQLRKTNPEWAEKNYKIHREAVKYAQKWFDDNPEDGLKIRQSNIKKAQEATKQIFEENGEKAEELRKIRAENIKIASQFLLDNIKKLFEENPIKFNNKFISYDDLQQLKENDICGAWVIRAKFKAYKGTNRENERFLLGPFKNIKVYDEMSWAGRVIKHPEKQDWIITEQNPWKYAKWWYISNLYYDFEFELITDENGVTEEESLIAEAAYASKYNLFVEFTEDEEGRRIPVIEKHAYWSP